MRIAVTGRNGQLAMSLLERARADMGVEIIPVGRPVLDLMRPETIAPALTAAAPDLIVSAAALTGVDAAEDDPETAFAINARGAEAVAVAAARLDVPVIHLSSDYVFDGRKAGAYFENDVPHPLSVYGASKLAGEQAVAAVHPRHLILRTAWVYSPFSHNFVRTMLKLAETHDEVAVVSDQWGCPTSAFDLADGLLVAARRLVSGAAAPGTYHLAGNGDTNWSGFAREIFTASREHGGPMASVRDIASVDYPQKARRPVNSRLECGKFLVEFGWRAPDWRKSTDTVVQRLIKA
jgi:dTDP-4-dehydrorhamnose reductase